MHRSSECVEHICMYYRMKTNACIVPPFSLLDTSLTHRLSQYVHLESIMHTVPLISQCHVSMCMQESLAMRLPCSITHVTKFIVTSSILT